MDCLSADRSDALHAHGLSKRFFRKGRDAARYFEAVASCDLSVVPGEVSVLMGRSGSGKSTLLNILCGLLEPTEGTVELCNKNLYTLNDAQLSKLRNESFGVVPQGQTAVHSLTVLENVKLPYLLYRDAGQCEEKASSLLEEMEIADLAQSYPDELSGGELRRMAIARALVCDPAFVFADEPTSDLDDESTQVVLDILKREAEKGSAVFMVTHDRTAMRIADRVLRMNAGVLSAD